MWLRERYGARSATRPDGGLAGVGFLPAVVLVGAVLGPAGVELPGPLWLVYVAVLVVGLPLWLLGSAVTILSGQALANRAVSR